MRLPRLVNTTTWRPTVAVFGMLCLGVLSGCDVPSFFDPSELAGIRTSNTREPLRVQILDELDPVLEAENRHFASAEPPRAEDMVAERADYVVGPNDLLQITVYDLEGPGLQTIKQTRVSGTGNITLPYLNNVVRAEGLSEIELQQAVADAYRQAGVLEQANVSVSVMEARNRAYSILGAVLRPGLYVITDEDFRVLDALTQAGDIQNPFLEELYIFRRAGDAEGRGGTRPSPATGPADDANQQTDDLAPPQSRSGDGPAGLQWSVLLQEQGADAEAAVEVIPDDEDPTARVGRIDGQDVIVEPGEDTGDTRMDDATSPPAGTGEPFEFNELPDASDIRVIRIPLDALRRGDLSANIVIRPRDQIFVPPGQIGFYYMGGHILTTGAYAFQGQKVTLKQAVTSARGLDGLAIPQRTDIIRRIGPNEEMFVRVDLARIFAGKSPDIYLKPNDHVTVGTNFLAPFLAAVRGGFRMTYGFGFLYDRNFAYDEDRQFR